MNTPKSTVWAVFMTLADGREHLLKAYAEERDARAHVARCTTQPPTDDGRDHLLSAAEIVGVTLTARPLPIW